MLQPSLQSFDSHSLSRQILIIDTHVNDHQFLIANASPEFDIFVLDPGRDGITQITEILQSLKLQLTNCFSLHLVSHGSPGCLYLGNSQLSLDTLETYAQQLQTWGNPCYSLYLYGCNVAAGDAGKEFLAKLHHLTRSNLYASAQIVGNQDRGGIWQLDFVMGYQDVRTSLPWASSVLNSYEGTLNNSPTGNAIPDNPTLIGTYDTPSFAYDVSIVGNYAYIADGYSGLQILDISNPSDPTLVGSYNTSGVAHGISVVGNYAYIADFTNGLQIIDISDPNNPTFVESYTASGVYDVSIVNNYAYIAVLGEGLQIIDISDPRSPAPVGNFDTPGGALDVSVVGNYAYVADEDKGLQIIDISDPSNPTLVGNYDTLGVAWSVSVVGNYAYVADNNSGLQIIDISDPRSPAPVGNFDTPGGALDVSVVGNYAYVADEDKGLQIIDISDPSNPTLVGSYDTSGYAWEVSVVDNYAYVADDEGGLQIIDLGLVDPITIIGTPQEDSTLTADTSNLADADGLPDSNTYVYQWQAFDGSTWNDIAEATDSIFIPGDSQVGQTIRVKVSYTDQGGTNETVISDGVTIANTNDAPTVANKLDDQSVTEETIFTYTIPNNTFVDIDTDDFLSFSAISADGSALPTWLSFDGNSFSGTPKNEDIGLLSITVTATDQSGATASDTFEITVIRANNAPTGTATGTVPNTAEDTDIIIQISTLVEDFSDPDGDNLSIRGLTADFGTIFNNGNGTYTFSPDTNYTGDVILTYTVTDNFGGEVTGVTRSFTVTPVNDVPIGEDTPDTPILVSTYDTSGFTQNVSIVGNYAYVADGSGGLQIIDISNPSSPILVGSYDTSGVVFDINIVGSYAYIADGSSGLQIIDISDLSAPTHVSTYKTPSSARSVSVIGNYAYVADFPNGFQIINISDPSNPTLVNTYYTSTGSSGAFDVSVVGNYAYVADSSSGLKIIDISSPNSLTLVGTYNTPGYALGISVVGNYAYIADGTSGLQIIDISNPNSPMLVGAYNTPNYAQSVSVIGNYAYIADGTSGLQIIDISNPSTPSFAGSYDTSGYATGIIVVDDYAYVADRDSGLQVIELGLVAAPITINGIPQEDSLLSADASNLIDADGLPDSSTYTYQWQQFDGFTWNDIEGATVNTFTPGNDQADQLIRVQMSYVDQGGTAETVTSDSIEIASNNSAPTGTATGIVSNTAEDTDLIIQLSTLLEGFSDSDSDALSVTGLTSNEGTLIDNGDGIYTLSPDENFNGNVTLTYTVTDNNGGDITGVTRSFLVTPVNDAPFVTNELSDQTATEDGAFSYTIPADAFSDVDAGDLLTYSATLADGSALPTWLNFNGNSFSGTPLNEDVGALLITVTATDQSGAATSNTFSLVVENTNDAPTVAHELSNQTAIEDEAFSYTIPANAFSDADVGDSLTFTANLADGSALPTWLSFDGSSFTGTPFNEDVGVLSITVIATDQLGAITFNTFDLVIENINDAPTGTATGIVPDTAEDTDLIIQLSTLLEGFSDPDGDALSVSGLTSDAGTIVDNNDGTFTFSPDADFNGSVTLTYTVTDSNGGDITGVSRSFSVTSVNDAPTVANELSDQTATEDEVFSYTVPSDTFSDIDSNDSLTLDATLADGAPLPTWLSFDGNSFTGIPLNADVGVLSITVTATDQSGDTISNTFDLVVENVNDAPTGVAISIVPDTAEDNDLIIQLSTLLEGFTDADGDTLSVSGLTADVGTLIDNNDGTYTFSPDADYNGSVTLTYTVTDNNGGDITGVTHTFSVTSVNDAPTVANEFSHQTAIEDEVFSYTIPVNAFSDVDAGDSLTFSATLADGTPLPSWLSFDGNSFTGTPLNEDVGVLSITVIAMDQSGATTSDTFNLTIANTNDSPTGTASGTVSNTLEDNDLIIQLSTLLEGFSDPDGDVLLVIGLTSDEGSVIDNGDSTYTFSPNANFNGTVTLTYTITDSNGGDITGVSRSFSVTPANDTPVVVNALSDQTATEDEVFSYTIPSDTFSDIDVNDSLTLGATLADGTPLPSWLSFDGNNFSGTPLNENVGVLSITVTAIDQAGATSSDTFELTIENVNDPAVITGDAAGSVTEDASTSSVAGSLSASDIDSTVGFTAQTHTVGMYGSFSIDAQGNWLYTLNNADEDTNVLVDGDVVTETFTVTTDDGTAQDIVITVNGTDDSKTDFNGDDLPDLVWRNASRGLTSIWFTDGQNRLSSGSTSNTVSSSSWITAGVGDYDKDGNRDDILWRNTVNGQNVVWFMDGLNKVGNAMLDTVTNTDWTIQGVGDFDHSGYVDDILWQHQGNGSTIVWTMDGATKTGSLDFGTVDTDWQAQGVGDFEANGNIDDIVWRNRQTGQNTIWETDGLIVENTVTTLPTMGANWRIEGVSDFDGDGYTDDLLWRNHSILFGGQITTWSTDDGSVTNTGSISPTVFDLAWDVVV